MSGTQNTCFQHQLTWKHITGKMGERIWLTLGLLIFLTNKLLYTSDFTDEQEALSTTRPEQYLCREEQAFVPTVPSRVCCWILSPSLFRRVLHVHPKRT